METTMLHPTAHGQTTRSIDTGTSLSPTYCGLRFCRTILCWVYHRHPFHTIGLSKIYQSQAAFHLKALLPAPIQGDSWIFLHLNLWGMDEESGLTTKNRWSEVSSLCLLIHVVDDGTNYLSFLCVIKRSTGSASHFDFENVKVINWKIHIDTFYRT